MRATKKIIKITGTANTMYARSSIPEEQRSHNAPVPMMATITFLTASLNTPRHKLKRTTPAITTGNTLAGRQVLLHNVLTFTFIPIIRRFFRFQACRPSVLEFHHQCIDKRVLIHLRHDISYPYTL